MKAEIVMLMLACCYSLSGNGTVGRKQLLKDLNEDQLEEMKRRVLLEIAEIEAALALMKRGKNA